VTGSSAHSGIVSDLAHASQLNVIEFRWDFGAINGEKSEPQPKIRG